MGIISSFARVIGGCRALARLPQKLDSIVAGIDNHSRLTNDKSEALIDGVTFLASCINDLMNRIEHVADDKAGTLIAVAADQSALLDRKFNELIQGFDNLGHSINSLLGGVLEATGNQLSATETLGARIAELQEAQLIMQREMADALDELTVLAKAAGAKGVGDWTKQRPTADPRPIKELAG